MSFKEPKAQASVDLMKREDLPEILAIERESFQTPWTEGMFVDELSTKHAQCLVVKVEIEGKAVIAAYIIFWLVAGEVHLHNLAVKREFRRQGLAHSLMKLMRSIAAQLGTTRLLLEVRVSNTEAIGLYRKCGFVVKGRRPRYYSDTQEDALIMWAENTQDD